jgi:hypothetical protein
MVGAPHNVKLEGQATNITHMVGHGSHYSVVSSFQHTCIVSEGAIGYSSRNGSAIQADLDIGSIDSALTW